MRFCAAGARQQLDCIRGEWKEHAGAKWNQQGVAGGLGRRAAMRREALLVVGSENQVEPRVKSKMPVKPDFIIHEQGRPVQEAIEIRKASLRHAGSETQCKRVERESLTRLAETHG